MKTLKLTTLILLAMLVNMSFASRMVKSKLGDLDIMAKRGGSEILCTMGFNSELALIKEVESDALVKGDCTGWVAKSKIEYVAQAAGDKTFTIDNVDIIDWVDNKNLYNVFNDQIEDFEGVTIDRDFKEYLTYTIDREQTEMKNGEN